MARHPAPEESEEAAGTSAHSTLHQVALYAALGIGLLLGIVALIFALLAISRINPLQTEIDSTESKIKKLNSELNATRFELKKAREAVQLEQSAREEENKKQDELSSKIIENVVPLQKKLKISPTLQEQLQPASAVQPAASNAAAPQKAEKPHSPQVKSMLEAIKKFNEQ